MRSRHGPSAGTYRLVVEVSAATDYTLRTVVADLAEERLDATESRSLSAGRSHEYRPTVPEGDGDDTLERVGTLAGPPDWAPVAAGVAAAGAAAGALGHARRDDRNERTPGSGARLSSAGARGVRPLPLSLSGPSVGTMGLFKRLGRGVGQFTSDARAAAEEYTSAEYHCSDCGRRYAERPAACLECASGAIRPLEEAS